MKNLAILALVLTTPALAAQLTCKGNGEKITIDVQPDKIAVSSGYGELSRENQDPDCAYRAIRYACYEEGQLMINIPHALADGTVKEGVVYIQADTDDNADSHNHALLGDPYKCVAD